MKRTAFILALLAATGIYTVGQAAEPNPPILKFKAETPLQLPPDLNFGETSSVTVNSKGHVFVFQRANTSGPAYAASAAQLLEFDNTGKFVREIGRNLYGWAFAHGVRVDRDDNVWTIDKGANTVLKFGQDGRVLEVYGRRDEASDYRAPPTTDKPRDRKAPVQRLGAFDQPTDAAWDSKGNLYVSDGYENSRVAKIDKDGNWVKSWGERGTGPGQFLTPHGIAIDAKDNIYVVDRGNARIQVFNTDGKFLRQFTMHGQVPPYPYQAGAPNPFPGHVGLPEPKQENDPNVPKAYPDAPPPNLMMLTGAAGSICVTPPGPNQVLFLAGLNPDRLYKVSLEGKVLGMLGAPGGKLGQFRSMHGIACQDDHTVWVADQFNWRVQKITIE